MMASFFRNDGPGYEGSRDGVVGCLPADEDHEGTGGQDGFAEVSPMHGWKCRIGTGRLAF